MDQQAVVDGPSVVESLEDCKEDIFRLYMTEKRTLEDTMQIIKDAYGIVASDAIYKSRLRKWGYH
ncbi:hypothetical protein DL98DRAFT_595497 [Cadophora sp. DSE1049]|nr:hypothetical protein DL98DRAFT_595497 [Cadophora sp. DSE1049]